MLRQYSLKFLLMGLFFFQLIGFNTHACTIDASFTFRDSSGFFTFTNTSIGNWNRQEWQFGNDAHYIDDYIIFKSAGTFKISLLVFDTMDISCHDTFSTYITTGGVCWLKASFTVSESNNILFAANISTSNIRIGNLNIWDYGDNTRDTNVHLDHTHQYDTTGTFTIWFKTHLTGIPGCVDSISKIFKLLPCSVKADFTHTDKGNLNVEFQNTSIMAGKYAWRVGNLTNYTIKEFWFQFPDDGTYNVRLIAKQSGRELCADTITKRIYGTTCRIKAGFTHSFKNNILIREFKNTTKSGTFFKWDFGDSSYSEEDFPTHAYSKQGIYNVKLITFDTGFVSCADTFTMDIGVYPCSVTAKIGFKDSLGFVRYYNESTGANKHYWYISTNNPWSSDSLFSNEFNKLYTSCNSANIYLQSFDTLALCSDIKSAIKSISPIQAKFEIIPDSNNYYAGLLVDKSKYSISNVNYLWNFGDGDTSMSQYPTHTYSGSGPYKICLTLTGANCNKSWCDTIEFDSTGQMKRSFQAFTIKVLSEADLNTSSLNTFTETLVKLYPNPFTDNLKIETGKEIKYIRIFALDGRVLIDKVINSTSTELNTSRLPSSVYLLEISLADGSTVYKRIVK